MIDICESCQISNCENCPLEWNEDPCNSEMVMLFSD